MYDLDISCMPRLIFLGYIAKILFLDTYAKILQVRTNLDIFMHVKILTGFTKI